MKVNRIFITTLLMLALAPSSFAAGTTKSGSFKCWTNKQGIRECGNEVPPEYAQGETSTVNKKGITTNVEARARAQEDIDREKREKEEAAIRAAEEKRKNEKQAAYDRVLLASYLSEADIIAARDRKLSAIDASVELNNATAGKLEEKKQKLQQRVDAVTKSGKEPSPMDKEELASLQKQIDSRHEYVASRQEERKAIMSEYEGYINRFRELKGQKQAQ